ncbi:MULTISPECIES: MFS transporter [unclassified Curtobacterium]|uniref:MFS transporter n=1 Tax=unclassified Curtobacterium TaxID=257496 RepID=UPI000826B5A8|nr:MULTISPECIES: MFS transporter [unclassified Curtobacterium]WIA97086.1 MFS transporter [Curtobacterium sp. MCBA15_004]WIB00392.1 MFS transporter [Curtobacterium sp. MCBA15_012]
MPLGLIALALGGFGIGLTEFGIVGLLPEVAADTGVTEPVAGYLVSGYALGVALGAIALTALVYRLERRKVLLGLMVLFVLGNLLSAIAPDYSVLLIGRVVAALCHGAFFGIGAVVAADMVAEDKKAGAISLMFAGLTAANVLGVPLGTFLGQQLGWRSTFWAITVIGVVALIGIRLLVPVTPGPSGSTLRAEFSVFRRPQVWVSAIASVFAFGAVVGAFTYIAFTLTEVTGFSTGAVPWLLVLFGAGTFVGNFVGGKLADRALNPALISILLVLAVVLVVFALTAANPIATVVLLLLLGTVGLSTAPGLQLRTMAHAGDAPTVASGANIAAFNVGNAIGAWLGGVTIAAGLGFTSPLWAGAALAGVGALVLVGGSLRRRSTAPATTAPVPVVQ